MGWLSPIEFDHWVLTMKIQQIGVDQAGIDLAKARLVEMLAGKLLTQRDKCVEQMTASGWPKKWKEAADLYDGIDTEAGTTSGSNVDKEAWIYGRSVQNPANRIPTRSRQVLNITRSRTDAGIAGMIATIWPVSGDKNWDIKPTPVPSLVNAGRKDGSKIITNGGRPMIDPETGDQLTGNALIKAEQSKSDIAAAGMIDEIDDQLSEANWRGLSMAGIRCAAIKGSCVFRAPVIARYEKSAWLPLEQPVGIATHAMKTEIKEAPAPELVQIEDFFPPLDCGDDVSKLPYVWERSRPTAGELRKMVDRNGYFPEQLRKVLQEGPDKTATDTFEDRARRAVEGMSVPDDARFEMWTRVGILESADLAQFSGSDPLEEEHVDVALSFVNGTCIGGQPNMLESGQSAYSIFTWTPVDGQLFGIGIPHMIKPRQVDATSYWRMMNDNNALSVGPQIVVDEAGIRPANSINDLHNSKVWLKTGEGSGGNPFEVYNIPTNQQSIMASLQTVIQFADEESGVPKVAQGMAESVAQTAHEAGIRASSLNQIVRNRIARYDEQVTKPMIERFYEWNMLYNPKPEIKGDFKCIPTGVMVHYMREEQYQKLQMWLPALGNPALAIYINGEKLVAEIARNDGLSQDVLNSPEEVKKIVAKQQEAAGQNQNPALQVAQIRAQSAAQEGDKNRALEERLATMEARLDLMRIQQNPTLKLEDIKSKMAGKVMDINAKREDREREIIVESPSPRLA